VVIGAGVSGLAATHRLVELQDGAGSMTRPTGFQNGSDGSRAEIVVLEASDAAGGSIRTGRRDGFLLEAGPDAFITQKPWALALCRRLGLTGRLIQTNEHCRRTFVVRRGRLHAMPEGFMMLAPTRLWPFAFSRLFSLRGKLRMGLDLLLPRGPLTRGVKGEQLDGDESLASFVRRRLGQEALDWAAQPLVSGIYTADPEQLSLKATMPRFLEMEQNHRSLIRGMRRAGKAEAQLARGRSTPSGQGGQGGARYSMFVSFADGMDAFVEAIVRRLPPGALRLRQAVTGLTRVRRGREERALQPGPDADCAPPRIVPSGAAQAEARGSGWRWRVELEGEGAIDADGVILAAPAHALARITARLDSELSAMLARIDYAASATLNLAYRREQIAHPLDGFGLVVPHRERRTIIAATFSHVKFAGRAPDGMALLRAFIGGALNPDVYSLDDDDLRRRVQAEVADLLGIRGDPLFTDLNRWPASMPQYAVGHLDRVAAINERLREAASGLPIAAAGNAFGGVGIPDCIHSGEQAAEAVLAALRGRFSEAQPTGEPVHHPASPA